jgi:hypothetical protein
MISEFKDINSMLDGALRNDVYFYGWQSSLPTLRPNEQYTDYQWQERGIERPIEQDRVFPLETVELQRFNAAHGAGLDVATIHTGPFADEYARSFHAFALTVGEDIFFRDNAFDTGSEEGRKTLAYELAQVAQHDEGWVNGNNPVKELEAEAEAIARQEAYGEGPYITVELDGKAYRVDTQEIGMMAEQLVMMIERKVRERRLLMDGEGYLRLLTGYKAMLERGANGIFDAL